MMDIFLCTEDDVMGDYPPCPHPDPEGGFCLTCGHPVPEVKQ